MPRKHPLFPTHSETTDNPNIAYSDHLPILTIVPLGEGAEPVRIISLNVLGQSCSGIHPRGFSEEKLATKIRYDRIGRGLAQGIHKQAVDVVLLQEASPLLFPALQMYLGKDWKIIVDESVGIISCYKKQRFKPIESSLNEVSRIRSISLRDRNSERSLDVHNLWGKFSPFPHHMEAECRRLLTNTISDVSAIIGDSNSRIAPIDNRRRNITTGIVPAVFNAVDELPEDLQRTDYPDGGFYRSQSGAIKQLETQILDFATGDLVVDERSEAEIDLWPEFRMVMCLDDHYQEQAVINGQSIFSYEESLKLELNDPSLLVRMASDSFNNKAVAIRFPARSYAYEFARGYLKDVDGLQCRTIIPTDPADGQQPFKCIFVPIEQAELLHKAVFLSVVKNQVAEQLSKQIEKLSQSHWYFRSEPEKIARLINLRDEIVAASSSSTRDELFQIIDTWENKAFDVLENNKYSVLHNTNKALMGVHRNIFFSRHRPGVQTATETLIQELKDALQPATAGLVML